MSWVEVPLHKVADLESGFGFPRERQGDSNQEFPFFRVSDMNLVGNEVLMSNHTNTVSRATLAKLHARAFPPGTVIFPKIGAAIATEKKRILTKPATYDNNVMGAVPKDGVVPQFLYYWFLRLRLSDFASASHVPSIRKSVMGEIPFGLPPPTEQRRIVEILDQAEALRKLRRDADAKAARILPALFIKMFGDPATNPMGWPVKALGAPDVCEINPRAERDLDDDLEVSFVPMAYVDEHIGRIVGAQTRLVSQVRKGFTAFRENDVLFAKITPCMQNGKAVIATDLVNGLGYGSTEFHVLRAQQDIAPEWVFTLVRLQTFRDQARAAFTGSAGQQRVPSTFLKSYRLPVPSPEAMAKFAHASQETFRILEACEILTAKVDKIFALLLQRAFSGKLTATWRQAHLQELLVEMQDQARLLNLPAPESDALAS